MKASELKSRIKSLAKQIYHTKIKSDDAAIAYDELVKFPELKKVITDLLTNDFDKFLESVDWVAPRPSTFRINLLNGQNFLLIFDVRSWIAQVEGKKYYLLNLDEEEMASKAISRILAYGTNTTGSSAEIDGADAIEDNVDFDEKDTETDTEEL